MIALHTFAWFYGCILAPLLWLGVHLNASRMQPALLRWKQPGIVLLTISAFLLNLLLLVLAVFFFASYMGRIQGQSILGSDADLMLKLGVDSSILLFGTTVLYLALQRCYVQVITQEGILLNPIPLPLLQKRSPDLIKWEDINDYYVLSDYPITVFRFIVPDGEGRYAHRQVKVPFYVLPRFEQMLEKNYRRQQELRAQSRDVLRKMSNN